jgi:hypothetical protein
MTSQFPIEFKRNAVEPVACLKAGWNLIAIAYEQVFGLGQVQSPRLPPPPPSFA